MVIASEKENCKDANEYKRRYVLDDIRRRHRILL